MKHVTRDKRVYELYEMSDTPLVNAAKHHMKRLEEAKQILNTNMSVFNKLLYKDHTEGKIAWAKEFIVNHEYISFYVMELMVRNSEKAAKDITKDTKNF